jgi:hypothetical protein
MILAHKPLISGLENARAKYVAAEKRLIVGGAYQGFGPQNFSLA